MSLTIGNWVFVCFIGLVCLIGVTLFCCWWDEEQTITDYTTGKETTNVKKLRIGCFVAIFLGVAITLGIMFGINWYNTSTANGIRHYKDFKSNMNNGIYREITITNDDGKVIYDYTGKCDIQEQEEVDERKLKFENEQGKRVIIYYGITDTVKIIEKDKNKEK